MEKKALIIFHQGWTDIILCIGIVFYNLNIYDKIVLMMREDAKDMIDFIFRKEKKLTIDYKNKCEISDIHCFNSLLNSHYSDYIFLSYGAAFNHGLSNLFQPSGSSNFFYTPNNIDKNESYNSFLIERDYELENKKYMEFMENMKNMKNMETDYVIINEDINRNINIDRGYINKDAYIFNINDSSKIVFDMLKIIENAKEIHLTSTFWSLIIYNLQKKYNLFYDIPIYFHNYAREGYYSFLYEGTDWIFIN